MRIEDNLPLSIESTYVAILLIQWHVIFRSHPLHPPTVHRDHRYEGVLRIAARVVVVGRPQIPTSVC